MAETAECPITKEPAQVGAKVGDYTEFKCSTCGIFRISDTALALAGDNPDALAQALQVARNAMRPGEVPVIDNVNG